MRKTLLLFLAGIILASPAWCGGGSYTPGNPSLIQLNVRFEGFDEEPDTTAWEPLFRQASRLLFDATEKQVKISKVTFMRRCPSTAHRADVIIFNDQEEALASPGLIALNKPGLGQADLGISLSTLHRTVGGPGTRGEFGLVHELGHYVFGLRDEYKDKNGLRTAGAGCASRVNNIVGFDPVASLMDGGTSQRTNVRTEFCGESNHRTGRTFQDAKRKIGNEEHENVDSWKWIVTWTGQHFGAPLKPPPPGTLPVSDPSGFAGEPEFAVETCGGLRLSLGIDNSESMRVFRAPGAAGMPSSEAPVDVVKESAKKLIQLLEEGDSAGVAVGGTPDVVPMRMLSTESRSRALSEIRTMRDRDKAGWARVLQESFRQIGGAEGSAGNRAVVLVSEGSRDGGETPDDLLSAARQRGVVIHAIGIGKESTELRRLAEETGGRYRLARNAAQVNASLLSVLADLKGRGTLAAEEGEIQPGKTRSISVHVDSETAEQTADFLLAWSGSGADLEMTLEGPDQKIVSAKMENAVFQENFGKLKRHRIFRPALGLWKVTLTNPGTSPLNFAFQAHSWTDAVTVTGFAVDDVVDVSDPMVLKAAVSTRHPVSGAKVTARIERPDGAPVVLDLFDDGSPEHQDELAGDGAYSNVFEDYAGTGTYTVDLKVDSEGGRTVHPEDEDYVSQDVPHRFVRTVRFSAMVQGDPDE